MSTNNKRSREAIKAIENKYGLVVFMMGFTHLFEKGWDNFSEEAVRSACEKIREQSAEKKLRGECEVMTSNLQIGIIECAYDLSRFGIMDLFAYIKTDVYINGI